MTLTSKEIRKSSTSAWSNRAKSSAKLMQITVDATLHAMGDSGDWTVLAHHIKKGLDNGAPSKEMANIKLIAMSIADGMTMKKDEAQPTGIKISMKKAVRNDDAISKVDALIERKVSIGGTAIGEALDPKSDDDDDEAELDYIKKAASLIKMGYSADVLYAAMTEAAKQQAA
tara:strand:- start:254 stop:769 length:516 start_codon:yes stop_codon:yes gene_type:complete